MDITFKTEEGKFNYRTGAIIIREGKLLAMRDKSPYYYLPGGRVHLHERVEDAVLREVREELGVEGSRMEISLNSPKMRLFGIFRQMRSRCMYDTASPTFPKTCSKTGKAFRYFRSKNLWRANFCLDKEAFADNINILSRAMTKSTRKFAAKIGFKLISMRLSSSARCG